MTLNKGVHVIGCQEFGGKLHNVGWCDGCIKINYMQRWVVMGNKLKGVRWEVQWGGLVVLKGGSGKEACPARGARWVDVEATVQFDVWCCWWMCIISRTFLLQFIASFQLIWNWLVQGCTTNSFFLSGFGCFFTIGRFWGLFLDVFTVSFPVEVQYSLTPLTYGMYKGLGGVSLSIVMLVGVVQPYLMSHSQFCIAADEDPQIKTSCMHLFEVNTAFEGH